MSESRENKPRKQQQRSLRTKQKLLDAALDAFSEGGFAGTSTRDIAARAGVHHPLITYHFSNKDKLWRSAVAYVFADFIEELKGAREKYKDSCPRTRFALMIGIYVRYAASKPALHKIILQESSNPSSRLDWLTEHFLKPLTDLSSTYVAELQSLGVMPAGNPALIYNMIRVSTGGLIALSLELKNTCNVDFQSEAAVEELTDLIVRIFLPGDTEKAAA